MRYSLQTLIFATIVSPPMLALLWWVVRAQQFFIAITILTIAVAIWHLWKEMRTSRTKPPA